MAFLRTGGLGGHGIVRCLRARLQSPSSHPKVVVTCFTPAGVRRLVPQLPCHAGANDALTTHIRHVTRWMKVCMCMHHAPVHVG